MSDSTSETELPKSLSIEKMSTVRLFVPVSNNKDIERMPRISLRALLAIFTVCLIYFAQLVNLVGAGAQTQTIEAEFGGSSRSVWISSPLTIATVVLSPIVSQLSDYWGRRWSLVILTLLGAAGSIIVSRSNSMSMVIAGFTVTGLSYGAQPLLHVVSSEVIPRKYRSLGQAADLLSNALGGVTALLVGGALNSRQNPAVEGFRIFWYMTAALFGVAGLLATVLYQPPPTEKQVTLSFKMKMNQIDWIGYSLLAASLILTCVGLSWSKNPFAWSNLHVAVTLSLGLFLLVALFAYESLLKTDGMFHHGLFKNRNFPIALACLFCEGLAFFAANQYFPFQLSVMYERNPLMVGVRYSIPLIVSIFASLCAGVYCLVSKRVRWITVAAFVLFVGFFAVMAGLGPGNGNAVWGIPVLLGAGLGLSLCSLITAAQLSTPPELLATATGLVISVRSLGGSIGLAIYNTLFVDKMNNLGSNVASTAIRMGLDPSDVGMFVKSLTSHDHSTLSQLPNTTPSMIFAAEEAMLATYGSAFRAVWITACCFAAVAALLAGFLEDRKEEFNMRVDAPMDREDHVYLHDIRMK